MSVFKKGDKIKRHTVTFKNAEVGKVYIALEDSTSSGVLLAEFPDDAEYDDKLFTKVEEIKEEPFGKRFFGHKIRVNPETSEMIQKAVFEAGGSWPINNKDVDTKSKFIFIDKEGEITHLPDNDENYFNQYVGEDCIGELIVELEVVKSLKIVDVIPTKTPE